MLYTPLADEQLDDLHDNEPADLYNAVIDCLEYIDNQTDVARQKAPPLQDAAGRAMLSMVVMYPKDPRWFLFWRLEGIEPVVLGVGPLPEQFR